MNLRYRGPKGQFTLSGLDPTATFASLQQSIAEASGIPAARQEILKGFPPQPMQVPNNLETSIAELGFVNGESVILRERESPAVPDAAAPSAVPDHVEDLTSAVPDHVEDLTTQSDYDEDEQLARALAASMQDSQPGGPSTSNGADRNGFEQPSTSQSTSPPKQGVAFSGGKHTGGKGYPQGATQDSAGPPKGADNSPGATSTLRPLQDAFAPVAIGDGSVMMRRIIESDNSCLFNAVGYVMERSRQQSRHLREVIADTVAQDQFTYTAEFLGKSNHEYQQWIKDPTKWGGAIELSILSRYYGREIAALDIQTKRVDIYGQEEGYQERAFILYDGLHYDALAQAVFEGAPEELDITLFEKSSTSFHAVERSASGLLAQAHNAKQYTDTGNFTLMCGICKAGVKGEKEALQHAKETGHQSFQEYH